MGNDVLILTIYGLVVIYVLYQMALDLERDQQDQVLIGLNTDRLLSQAEAQLAQQPGRITAKVSAGALAGFNGGSAPAQHLDLWIQQPEDQRSLISVAVTPLGPRSLTPIRCLTVKVTNRSPDMQVYIDWDQSSMTYLSPQSQRVIRLMASTNLDLSLPQVRSVINPGEASKMDVATEQCFERHPETQRLEPRQPLIDLRLLAGMLAPKIEGFEELALPKSLYTLSLLVGLKPITARESQTTQLLLPFSFELSLLPAEIAFPPVRWLLERPRRSAENFFTTMILGRPPYRR